ncbi:hypothetical protein CRG98_033411 [Punica granatum]|uniref:Terpene synthase N-terminal domain-containing protein n=1 Tax=Punica granatum TaxID=22663 RepID=A0A2I0IR15_PUNGR|nr:hypothetical protein CRG98_033411 [Punica granatum]
MSAQSPTVVSSASPPVHAGKSERRSVDFLPSIWGDHFLNHASHSMMIHESAEKQILGLESEVKRMLDVNSSPPEKLNLIDQIQRLGISYLFEREIDAALEQIHQVYFERDAGDNFDLNTTALMFRLLRQQGYRISCKDAFKWSLGTSNKIVRASATIARLMDDIVSHKFEQERGGHVASAVECFTNQYGVTEQQAKEELWKKVDDAWKDINKECLCPRPVLEPLLARILNLTRVMDVLYKDKDCYTHPDLELKQLVASVLIKPIPS